MHFRRKTSGFSARTLLLSFPILIVALVAAWVAYARLSVSSKGPAPLTYVAKRGTFIHEVTENGEVESASNIEITSQVKSLGSSGTVILEIVPEGTIIRPEDCIPEDAVVPLAVIEQLEEYHRTMGIKLADYNTERDPRFRKDLVAQESQPPVTEQSSENEQEPGASTEQQAGGQTASLAATDPVAAEDTNIGGNGRQDNAQNSTGQSENNSDDDTAGETTFDPAREASKATAKALADLPGFERRYPPGTKVLTFEDVKDKMVLVRLDSSSLENQLVQQQIQCENSRAAVVQAESNYEAAKIALQEYLEGSYKQQYQDIQYQITMAEENLARAQQYYAYSKLLHAKGYISDRELQANRFDVEKKRIELEMAKTKLRVLEAYTKQKTVTELLANIQSAEAKLQAARKNYQLDLEKLWDIEDQIRNCTIFARHPGQVVYANVRNWRGGNEVVIEPGAYIRERQTIIRLPDPTQMQVKARINESRVNLVQPGMPATIRLDAFPDQELRGVVQEVSDYPAPTSFFTANIKEYETIIKILDPPQGLRPGFTAQVRILVAKEDNVLQVPVQAVFEHHGKHYCIVYKGDGTLEPREVKLGLNNDKFVVIKEGLEEGETVVLNAQQYRAEVGLAEEEKQETEEREGSSEPQAQQAPGRPRSEGPQAGTRRGREQRQAGGQAAQGRPDPAAIFSKLDRNGDGVLDKDELPAPMQQAVSMVDTNKDGKIDRGEWTAAAKRFFSGRRPPQQGSPQP